MKKNLTSNPYSDLKIFKNMDSINIPQALKCLNALEKKYKKDDFIIQRGEKINSIGILLRGNVYVYNINYLGERNIIFELKRGDLIGGSTVFSDYNISQYEIVCVDESEVLFINPENLMNDNNVCCSFKTIIMRNLIFMISNENKLLRDKMYMNNIKSLREKIYNYLYIQYIKNKSPKFTIPFINRLDFADYLGVNVSALSRELGRMRDEDILSFYKNSFEIKKFVSDDAFNISCD